MAGSAGWQASGRARRRAKRRSGRLIAFAAGLAGVMAASTVARADIAAIVSNLGTEPAVVNGDSHLAPGMALWVPLPVSMLGPGAMRVEAVDASGMCGVDRWAVRVVVSQGSGSTSSSHQCVGRTTAEPQCLGVFLSDGRVSWRRVPEGQCAEVHGREAAFPLSPELMELGEDGV